MGYKHYRLATFNLKISTRRRWDGLFQLIWSKDNVFFYSRTTGNEWVPEIWARNEDYDEEGEAFIFVYFTKG